MIQRTRSALHVSAAIGAAFVVLSLSATAGHPLHSLLGTTVPDCIGKWCADAYCPKKEPCEAVPLCFGCDDYCSKKVPCVRDSVCFGCDDYCKKCPPSVCYGPLCQFLECGPTTRRSCECAGCAAAARIVPIVRSAERSERSEDGKDGNTVNRQPVIIGVPDSGPK